MDATAERRLIRRARAGVPEAFDRLMLAHQDRLYRFLRMRGAGEADARDLVQDTFLAAWRHLHGYRERWRFSTWLFTIARRQAGRRADAGITLASEPAGTVRRPEDALAADQQRVNLWRIARRRLDNEHFTALWLYYGEDRNIAETARILGRTTAWVKISLYRSRRRLSRILSADDWLGEQEEDPHERPNA